MKKILLMQFFCDDKLFVVKNQNSKIQIVQHSKTQIVTKLINTNCDKTKKKNIVTKLKSFNCDKT